MKRGGKVKYGLMRQSGTAAGVRDIAEAMGASIEDEGAFRGDLHKCCEQHSSNQGA